MEILREYFITLFSSKIVLGKIQGLRNHFCSTSPPDNSQVNTTKLTSVHQATRWQDSLLTLGTLHEGLNTIHN